MTHRERQEIADYLSDLVSFGMKPTRESFCAAMELIHYGAGVRIWLHDTDYQVNEMDVLVEELPAQTTRNLKRYRAKVNAYLVSLGLAGDGGKPELIEQDFKIALRIRITYSDGLVLETSVPNID